MAVFATACGSSAAGSKAANSPAATPSAAASSNVTAATADFTGKPPPAGAIVMTMANFMINPSLPIGAGSRIVFYVDNKDPSTGGCDDPYNTCHLHGLLVLGPGGTLLGKTEDVLPGHQAVLTLDGIRPGTYRFYCPVLDHRFVGMAGQLTVN